jgi:hypothetical protein
MLFTVLADLLTIYGMLAFAMSVCVFLFCTLKREISRLERRGKNERQTWELTLERLTTEIDSLRTAMAEHQAEPRTLAASGPALNLNRRAQVLRLDRRGETPQQIAAILKVPQNEVELLLKLHRAATNDAGSKTQTTLDSPDKTVVPAFTAPT